MICVLDFSGSAAKPSVRTIETDGRPERAVVREAIRQNGSASERIDYSVGNAHVSVKVKTNGSAQAVRIVWPESSSAKKAEMIELAEHTWEAFRQPRRVA